MRYRILCCSDTHGQRPPDADETGAIAWLHGGDVAEGSEIPHPSDQIDTRTDPLLAPMTNWFQTRSIPVYPVRGNHDVQDCFHAFAKQRDITGSVAKLAARLWVAGVGWNGERHFELPTEHDLARVCDSVRRQVRRVTEPNVRWILLTHYPAKFDDTFDAAEYAGQSGIWYDAVRELVEELRPVAIVQGHNHRWFAQQACILVNDRSVLIACRGPTGCSLEIDTENAGAIASL